MTAQPTPAALRAVASVFDRFFNVPARTTPEELALLVDAELAPERERARELERALSKTVAMLDELRLPIECKISTEAGAEAYFLAESARDMLAKSETLRADREGGK
jgi:hypothetical protein